MENKLYPPVHEKMVFPETFDRLDMLWERYPQYHEKTLFSTLDQLLEEHESYQKDFDEELKAEYLEKNYEQFLIQLSWKDLPCRQETRKLIEKERVRAFRPGSTAYSGTSADSRADHADVLRTEAVPGTPEDDASVISSADSTADSSNRTLSANPYVQAFMSQFENLDMDHKAYFLFPESFTSQFFVVEDICRRAEEFHPVRNLFPDEKTVHYLAVFDKRNMDDVLLMYHLLYTNASEKVFGGYSLYDYSLPWYQSHLRQDGIVLRSPYLPDRLAKYQGHLPFYHNPAKTVYVRRNIEHILESGYFHSELELFRSLTEIVMPFFQWWYQDLAMYEEKDGYRTSWKLERTRIRTRLTAEGVINPKWKNELTLFRLIRKKYPDTLYQYRPEWLGRQSLDLYIPSLKTAIEYQGVQHYTPVEFFGGEEALKKRQELDRTKRQLCEENGVHLIEWPYSVAPSDKNLKEMLGKIRSESLE